MNKERVVITGFSAVTPIGSNINDFWENNINGVSGIQNISSFDIPNEMSKVAGIVNKIDIDKLHLTNEEKSNYDRSCLFALSASYEALTMANIEIHNDNNFNVHIASAISNITKMEETLKKWSDNGKHSIPHINENNSYLNEWFKFNTVSKILSDYYKFNGENSVIATGCTGGVDAIGYSFRQIQNKETDLVLTGATETPITPLVVSSFSKINATTNDFNDRPFEASRPFDIDRSGFVLSEGCGILILESLTHALERNATIYGEILGFSSTNNAEHMTDIPENGNSISIPLKKAISESNISIDNIDYINLHGSSTPQNDIAESNALQSIFKDKASKIPVTSIKSQIGHALSASNAIEIVSAIKSLETGVIPPTINVENQDPRCNLNVITKSNMPSINIRNIAKISSGFSGIHSSLVFGKYEEGSKND